ncbi:unnamed protein product [Protopolystoma xenopodis]|uniref:Uncharacterized protein n=1 Tax=Protopolystoma xenopodis TaxID=117903 RepID=A0A3S5C8J5_9PLAT|nr:unnamed protein product [Protopolystoma xenopodis]
MHKEGETHRWAHEQLANITLPLARTTATSGRLTQRRRVRVANLTRVVDSPLRLMQFIVTAETSRIMAGRVNLLIDFRALMASATSPGRHQLLRLAAGATVYFLHPFPPLSAHRSRGANCRPPSSTFPPHGSTGLSPLSHHFILTLWTSRTHTQKHTTRRSGVSLEDGHR